MFLRLEQFKLVLDKDDQLTVKDGDCVTTVDLAAPNAKEIKAHKAHRQVTRSVLLDDIISHRDKQIKYLNRFCYLHLPLNSCLLSCSVDFVTLN